MTLRARDSKNRGNLAFSPTITPGGSSCDAAAFFALMIMFALALAAAHPPRDADEGLKLCRPLLSRKAGGEIANIEVESTRRIGRTTTIKGRLTAFLGMGPPQPGSASAHHLIRSDFTFTCRLERGRVRAVLVNPTH